MKINILNTAISASGNTNNDFAIGTTTGKVTVAKQLNKTRTDNYALVLTATDNVAPRRSASATLTISVTAVESGASILSIGWLIMTFISCISMIIFENLP